MAPVLWDALPSFQFGIANGVQKGAVSSPVFFNIYTEEVYKTLRELCLGANIHGSFVGILGYTDDMCLIAYTKTSLQKMTSTLEILAKNSNIRLSMNVIIRQSIIQCMAYPGGEWESHLVTEKIKLNGSICRGSIGTNI